MESSKKANTVTRLRRSRRVRNKIRGTAARPRMCVVKSNKHVQVQLIDDERGVTIASFSTQSKELKNSESCKKSKVAAEVVGKGIAQRAIANGVREVVFDRGPFRYRGNGILARLADAARAEGLQF